MKTSKGLSVALAAAILASGCGVASAIPAFAADTTTDATPAVIKETMTVLPPASSTAPRDLRKISTEYSTGSKDWRTYVGWSAPAGVVGKVDGYMVTVKTAGKPDRIITTPNTTTLLTALADNTPYTIQVRAHVVSLDSKTSAFSPAASIEFKSPTTVIAPPTNLKVLGVTSSAAYFGWTAPANTAVAYYTVDVLPEAGQAVAYYTRTSNPIVGIPSGTLAPNRKYTVTVRAFAGNNYNAPIASSVGVTTGFATLPSVSVTAPAALATTATKTSVTATWKMPAVTGKVVNYTATLKEGTRAMKTVTTPAGKAVFTGLKANTIYTVSVQANAVSLNDWEKASSPLATKTVKTTLK